MLEYSQDQLRELYSSLPQKLQDALYSEQNGKNIKEICEKNNISDNDKIWDINKYVGYVLFGLLPPDSLSNALREELSIKKENAEKISEQISRFVFLPLKDILEPLYGIEMKFEEEEKKPLAKPKILETPGKNDNYRELI